MEKVFYFPCELQFFINDHLEGCVEKDPEGFLRKCGIINKQCLLKENKKEAVLGLASICHPYTRKYHPFDSGNKASQKNTELIFNFIKRKEKTNSTCH